MNVSFNDRMDAEGGRSYFARDFKPGPAQDAGLYLPAWFQFPSPFLALPEKPSAEAFGNLLTNKTPDGTERLTLRANTTRTEDLSEVANRRVSHQLTFSAWKALTLLALCLCDTRILPVWENVIWEGLVLASKFAAARVRKGGGLAPNDT